MALCILHKIKVLIKEYSFSDTEVDLIVENSVLSFTVFNRQRKHMKCVENWNTFLKIKRTHGHLRRQCYQMRGLKQQFTAWEQ